ncbi:major facilitator superfamily transporter [Colletotrichum orchidophilum]|uniref:Major facilitator superfamily transporter n=1 Tax=Colletotrichum orchidophilum TaxID=1209926 RepID=A0A1G4B5D9_9PEZI|nr:major facilitator superfamily transporter [Colletotrichum orchidophilum]OHE96617.1 major facilitator superfamily transporter [Colletotrichum orchidophilum]
MAAQSPPRREMADQLSYPNPSLGDTAGFAVANFAPRRGADFSAATSRQYKIRKVLVIISLLVGLFLATLDTSIIATSLITISEEIGDYYNAPWVLLAYLLTYMGCAVGIAKCSDIYGRRTLLFYSWAVFLLFSALCAGANSMKLLIVGRAFQGVGGSGLYSLAQTCLLEQGPAHNPALMGGIIGITLAAAFLLGPILGGVIVSKITWRWIFGINVPVGVIAMVCIAFAYPKDRNAFKVYSFTAFRKLDVVGMFSLFFGSVFLVIAIQRGGYAFYGWAHWSVIVLFVCSGICWIIFGIVENWLYEKRCPYADHVQCSHPEPVFPVHLARRRPFMCGLAVTFLTGLPYVALTVIIPERMQVIAQKSPLKSGMYLLPMLGACAVGSFVAGAVNSKSNKVALVMTVAAIAQVLGISLMLMVASAQADFAPAYGFTLIFGLGVGLTFGSTTILSGVEAESTKEHAVAQGILAQARALGGCLGVAICTALFNKRLEVLNEHLSPADLETLYHSPTASSQWSSHILNLVKNVYADSFRDQTIFMITACAIMVVAAIFTWEKDPRPIALLAGHAQHANKTRLQQESNDHDGTEMSDMGSVRSGRTARSVAVHARTT